jgi:hypothetical protein
MLSEDTRWSVVAQNARGDDSTLADLQTRMAASHFAMKRAMVTIPEPAPAGLDEAVSIAAFLDSGRGVLAEGTA